MEAEIHQDADEDSMLDWVQYEDSECMQESCNGDEKGIDVLLEIQGYSKASVHGLLRKNVQNGDAVGLDPLCS